MRDLSPVSRRSSTLFGIHSESKAMQQLKTVRAQNRRFTFIAAGAIFLLVVALICLIAFDMFNNANMAASRENRSRMEHLSDLMSAQHWKVVEDVQLSSPGQPPYREEQNGLEPASTNDHGFHRGSSEDVKVTPPGAEEEFIHEEQSEDQEPNVPIHKSQERFLFWREEAEKVSPNPYKTLQENGLLRGELSSQVEHSTLDNFRGTGSGARESSGKVGEWADRRWVSTPEEPKNSPEDLHANHRYTDEKLPEERVGGTPRPFTLQMGIASEKENGESPIQEEPPTLYGFQNQYASHSTYHEPTAAPPQDIRPVPNYHAFKLPKKYHKKVLEGFQPPMHFRGFYVRPREKHATQDQRNEEYYQKINDYFGKLRMENQTEGAENVSEPNSISEKNSELYTQVEVPEDMQPLTRKITPAKQKTKPFTVMLDIYPMEKEEEEKSLVDGSFQRPKDTIFLPMQSNGHYLQQKGAASNLIPERIKFVPSLPSASNLVPEKMKFAPQLAPPKYLQPIVIPSAPSKRKNRMIMKLNLYPRKQAQRRTWNVLSRQDDYEEYDGAEDYDEEDSGQEEHHCNGIVGHNPYGKPITAKWKDKHGNLVHAKYIALKQWDRNHYDEEEEDDENYDEEYADP